MVGTTTTNDRPAGAAKCAYVTLATNNGYCPGALVLAYSLRHLGAQFPLVCLVTPDVDREWRDRLEEIFQEVVEVPTLRSTDTANLRLLGRPDLDITYTKFHLWRLDQFEKGTTFFLLSRSSFFFFVFQQQCHSLSMPP